MRTLPGTEGSDARATCSGLAPSQTVPPTARARFGLEMLAIRHEYMRTVPGTVAGHQGTVAGQHGIGERGEAGRHTLEGARQWARFNGRLRVPWKVPWIAISGLQRDLHGRFLHSSKTVAAEASMYRTLAVNGEHTATILFFGYLIA